MATFTVLRSDAWVRKDDGARIFYVKGDQVELSPRDIQAMPADFLKRFSRVFDPKDAEAKTLAKALEAKD